MDRKQALIAISVIAIIALVVAGIAYAASTLVVESNPSETVTPLEPAASPSPSPSPSTSPAPQYTLDLAVNTLTPIIGQDDVILTATLNPIQENVEVFFYRISPTNASLGSSFTDVDGIATYNMGTLANTLPKVYFANCTVTIP